MFYQKTLATCIVTCVQIINAILTSSFRWKSNKVFGTFCNDQFRGVQFWLMIYSSSPVIVYMHGISILLVRLALIIGIGILAWLVWDLSFDLK